MTESQFLARQATDARAAIRRTLGELQRELFHTADPRAWVQTHPWTTLGVAAVAGFAAAGAVVQSKEQEALAHLAAAESALNGNGHCEPTPGQPPKPTEPSTLSKLANIALHAAQPLLASAIAGMASALTAKVEPLGDVPRTEPPATDPGI